MGPPSCSALDHALPMGECWPTLCSERDVQPGLGSKSTHTGSKPHISQMFPTSHDLSQGAERQFCEASTRHPSHPVQGQGGTGLDFALPWGPVAGVLEQVRLHRGEAQGLGEMPDQLRCVSTGWNRDSEVPRGGDFSSLTDCCRPYCTYAHTYVWYAWQFLRQVCVPATSSGSGSSPWGDPVFFLEDKSKKMFGSQRDSSNFVQFPVLDGSILFLISIVLKAYLNCRTSGLFHPQRRRILLNKSSK